VLGAATATAAVLITTAHTVRPAHAATAGVTQWGTVRSVTYHSTGASDAHGLIAIVEMFDGRRFVHSVSASTQRIPAPGEVWNIEGESPPPAWKPRK
jgi:hypothetical protein